MAVCLFLPSQLFAAAFSSANNLVVVRLGDGSGLTAGTTRPVFLDEFGVGGASASLVQSIAITSSGSSAVTLPDGGSHDGLLNRSTDNHSLVLAGYRVDAGAEDPTTFLSDPTIPRVVVRAAANGTIDTSTVLTDGSYTQNTVRAVATDNGSRFWVVGDNANNEPANEANIKGGLRYVATLGASTSVNLSQVQTSGGGSTPDNVRSVGIFDGQLYSSSGSSSSVGKAVFQVGTGLPTDGAQTLTTLTTDGASTNAFFFTDLSNDVAGVDTLYSSTSAAGIGLHKYAKSCVGAVCTWAAKGLVSLPGIEAMTATVSGSSVTLYATDGSTVFRLTDSTGYNANIAGAFSSILTAGANQAFRGLAFAPTPATLPGDYNHNGTVDAADYTLWRNTTGTTGAGLAADGDGNLRVDADDYAFWKAHYGVPLSAGSIAEALTVPEPHSHVAAVLLLLCVLTVSSRCTLRSCHSSRTVRI